VTATTLVLETERLRLRQYRLQDLDELAPILGDPETMRYYPRPYTREESLAWINRSLDRYRDHGFGLWAIVSKAAGEFLGNCGPVRQVVEERDEIELGWLVKRSHWRRGIASEAAVACRDYAFGVLDIERLIAMVRPENTPSRGVAEKIGMTVDREVDWHGFLHRVYAVERDRGGLKGITRSSESSS
jgi:[ribosomal protein S5]-alanine N-acetyltransferase